MMNKTNLTLYFVTDSSYYDEAEFLRRVEEACRGGVTMVQLREKNSGGKEYLDKARKVKLITDRYNIPLIIDDRADVAMACDAAGVHVGQSDLPVEEVRKLLGPDKIVGATAKTVEQAQKAYEQGADYLGVGAIYPTATKVKTVITKVETLSDIKANVPLPIVAIGGLDADNLDILKGAPIDGVAVVRAIMKADHPAEAAGLIKSRVQDIMTGRL